MTNFEELYQEMMAFETEEECRKFLSTWEKDQLVEFAKHLQVYYYSSKKGLIFDIVGATKGAEIRSRIISDEDTIKPLKLKEESYITLREGARAFYQLIEDTVPSSPERTEALKKVEEALMWANTALSRYMALQSSPGRSMKRNEELFLDYRGETGLDWRNFTLNPLAKTQPKQVCLGCKKHPCECKFSNRIWDEKHCTCGSLRIGINAECPNEDCDQR